MTTTKMMVVMEMKMMNCFELLMESEMMNLY
jgi:hypothetical protein